MGDDLRSEVAALKAEVRGMSSEVGRLTKVVIDSNGKSLVSQVAVLQNTVNHIDGKIDDLGDEMETYFTERRASQNTIRLAVITSCLSLLTSVVLAYLKVHP